MFGTEIIAFYWRLWIEFIGRLGLPWDKHLTAYVLLALAFYGIGYVFKILVRKS